MSGQNLQLAISAHAIVQSLLLERENDVMDRLERARQALAEIIDSLEAEFMNHAQASPVSATPTQGTGNRGHSDIVEASQRGYMEALIDLLHKKDAAMERTRLDNQQLVKELVSAHEETMRHISRGREESTKELLRLMNPLIAKERENKPPETK